jgi:hypothetical protein
MFRLTLSIAAWFTASAIALADAFSTGVTLSSESGQTFGKAPPKISFYARSHKTTTISATRRSWLDTSSKSLSVGVGSILLGTYSANAREITGPKSGELPNLPPEATRSYLQYRFPLQLAADFYIFDLQAMVGDTGRLVLIEQRESNGTKGSDAQSLVFVNIHVFAFLQCHSQTNLVQ